MGVSALIAFLIVVLPITTAAATVISTGSLTTLTLVESGDTETLELVPVTEIVAM
jgi:hypothetical protein